MLAQLGKEDAYNLLRRHKFGHLGCVVDGAPYVLPINYWCDDGHILVHSTPGQKINALRENPAVCLQVEEIEDDYNWHSAIAYGKYEEITAEQERAIALAHLLEKLPHLSPVESKMVKGEIEPVVFRIRIEKITGLSESWL